VERTSEIVEKIYATLYGAEQLEDYHERHDTPSLLVLTVRSPEVAAAAVAPWIDEIRGKRVVEIGAGIGYLSLEIAKHAEHVIACELDPAWTWVFVKHLYVNKPPNMTWIFGDAENVVGVYADVAVIRSYSGLVRMLSTAERIAPRVILDFAQGYQVGNSGSSHLLSIAEAVDAMVPGKLG
jgi:SAM-dependent methyltransferase